MLLLCKFTVCLALIITPSFTLIAPLKTSNGETDVDSMATHVLLLEQTVARLESAVSNSQAEISYLKSELQSKTGDISLLKTSYTSLDNRISFALNTSMGCSGPEVSFEVMEIGAVTYHVNADKTLTLGNVTRNVGGAYHKGSGIFRAPVGGTYLFSANIMETEGKSLGVELMKEGTMVSRGYAPAGTVYGTASITTILDVKTNEDVWLKADQFSDTSIHGYSQSYFGGILLCKH